MVKIYELMRDDKPLAEIRTDGKHYEAFNDLSGLAMNLGKGDWNLLSQRISKSSYLHLQLKQDGLPGILRYVLDSGDVVEATSDGLTFLMNGRLLSPQEAQQLQQNIHTGVLTVSQKQDIKKPIPVQAVAPEAPQYERLHDPERDSARLEYSAAAKSFLAKQDEGSVDNDPAIENMDTSNMERPEPVKDMAYYFKYGKFKDRV